MSDAVSLNETHRRAGLQTVDKALRVLLAFDSAHRSWGVSDLAREMGWDKASTQRLLATLAGRGFLAMEEGSRRYWLGPTLSRVARLGEQSGSLGASMRPLLARLAAECRESALLNVPQGAFYRTEAAVDSDASLRYSAIVGDVVPGHGGASGHAIYAHYPPSEVVALFGHGELQRFTDTTLTSLAALQERYAQVRQEGVAVSFGEYDAGCAAVASPIFCGSVLIGSVVVIGPGDRIRRDLDRCRAEVLAAAQEATAQLTKLAI